MDFVTGANCVFFVTSVLFTRISGVNVCSMSEAVSLRPFTAAARVRARASSCIYGAQSGTGTGFFFRVDRFPPVSIVPHVLLLLTEGQTGEAWERSNRSDCLSDIGEYQEVNVLMFVNLRAP